jgi:hypothetical protein
VLDCWKRPTQRGGQAQSIWQSSSVNLVALPSRARTLPTSRAHWKPKFVASARFCSAQSGSVCAGARVGHGRALILTQSSVFSAGLCCRA